MRQRSGILLLVACSGFFCAGLAHANPGDLNRCVGADGRSVYTDQPCDQMGATVKPQAPDITGSNRSPTATRVHVRDCAKSLDALRSGVQAALAADDVNQLAAFYQWAGMSSGSANAVMSRLQSLVARPLIGVTLLQSHAVPSDAPPSAPTATSSSPTRVVGIAIDQNRAANDPAPSRTVFAVTAYMGCWWVRF